MYDNKQKKSFLSSEENQFSHYFEKFENFLRVLKNCEGKNFKNNFYLTLENVKASYTKMNDPQDFEEAKSLYMKIFDDQKFFMFCFFY